MTKRLILLAFAFLPFAACADDDTAEEGLAQSSGVDQAPGAPAPTTGETTMTVAPPPAMTPAPAAAPAAPAPLTPAVLPAVGDGPSFHELPALLGEALCERIFSCCGASEAMTLVLGPQLTKENCPSLAPFYFGDYFKKYTLSMAEKRVTYFPDRVDACLQRLTGRSCAQFGASLYSPNPNYPYYGYPPVITPGTLPPTAFSCDELFAPVQAPTQLCQADHDCVDGFCVATIGTERRCQANSQDGQSCNNNSYPYVPIRCSSGLACVNGICRKVGKEGDTCYDTYSYSNLGCEAGLYCAAGTSPSPATCKPKLADGSTCSNTSHCKSGRCEYSSTAPVGYTCVPSPQPPSTPPLACSGPN